MEQRRLRGRDAELSRLTGVLDAVARRGAGRLVLVRGEAGIGKSALIETIARRAGDRGFAVASGKAEESDQLAPLSSLLAAVRRLLSGDDFAALAALREQRYWLVEQIAALIETRTRRGPVLVAVDDVQWADPLSRFALRVLPGRLTASPVLWLLAGREVMEPPPGPPCDMVALGPLSAQAVQEVAADILGAAADAGVRRLLEGAGGNPFLAVELLAGLTRDGAGPSSMVIPGVRARINALPPSMQRFLRIGAVLGRRFRLADAAALLGVPETALLTDLETGVRAALLDDDGDSIAFRHDLVRQAVYADFTPSARRAVHRAAAEHLRSSGRRAIEAARHLLIGAVPGDHDAVRQLRSAAGDVSTALPGLAADLSLRAVELCDESDPARWDIGEQAVGLLTRAHRNREAVGAADRLLAGQPPDEAVGRIEIRAGQALLALSLAAELHARVGATVSRAGVSDAERARLESLRALALARGTDPGTARTAGLSALAAGERLNDIQTIALALQAVGESDFSAGHCERALGYFVRLRRLDPAAITWQALAHQHLDEFDVSQKLLTEARLDCEQPGSRLPLAAVLWAQASHDYLLGRLDDLYAGLRTLADLDAGAPPEHGFATISRVSLTRVALLKGDLDGARAFLADARRHLGDPADPG
ncbi:ATP-binding protein, partial [Actinoplanes sp. RD1]|uniref:ATP-binding protein n=1 Tax=Actinoplanes sp. RD1 TaxID=3064538 RepID=UPI0027423195